jgi:hypothetical protein
VTALALGVGLHFASTMESGWLTSRPNESTIGALREAQATIQAEKLGRALAVHFVERAAYPNGLTELVDLGLIEERDLAFPFETPWVYERTDDGYRLSRPVR